MIWHRVITSKWPTCIVINGWIDACEVFLLFLQLFSFMKERVYCDPKPESEDALWERIQHVADNLEPELVKKVMRDGLRRVIPP